ncbi:MAG: hypothetical protein V1918_03810, partial [Planctomycetota bacterium]
MNFLPEPPETEEREEVETPSPVVDRFRLGCRMAASVLVLAALYLLCSLPRYYRKGPSTLGLNLLTLLFLLADALFLFQLYTSISAGDTRLRFFRRTVFWRCAIYAAALSIALTCLASAAAPRSFFRAGLFFFFTAGLYVLAERERYEAAGRFLRRGLGRRMDLLAFQLVLTVALLEGGLRIAALASDNLLFQRPNLKAAARIRRNTLRSGRFHLGFPANRLGFYDREFQKAKPRDTYRILALSDSFGVETVPYQRNFLTRIEEELAARVPLGPKHYEVMNLAVDGLSPQGYAYLLEQYFAPFHADMALVCLFAGNDITDLPKKNPDISFFRKDFWQVYVVLKRVLVLAAELLRSDELLEPLPTAVSTASGEAVIPIAEERPTFSRDAFMKIERERLRSSLKRGTDRELDRLYGD